MTEAKPREHRKYLIDKRFQIKYTLLVIAFSAVVYGILGYLLFKKELANSQILQIQNLELAQMIQTQDYQILYYLLAFFLLQVVSLFVLGILITHRIAGPVYRVQKYLQEVVKGEDIRTLPGVRTHDEFHSFFASLSDAITTLKVKKSDQRLKLDSLLIEINRAKSDPARLENCRAMVAELLGDT